ncbi:DUF2892 domain-containing protein [Inhella sp.]|uniref:YgaP family membrane protein n=1 Tax=Inhella sp. TaxID=1921806 RepID=UPI0035AF0723
MLKPNSGGLDRGLRVVGGLALVGLAVTGVLGPWAYLGVVLLATGAIGWCPLYTVLGVNSCPHQ